MKIPDQIDILGLTIDIIKEKTHNDSHAGHAIHKSNKIVLYTVIEDGKYLEDREADTFLHEILHYLSCALSLDLSEENTNRLGRGLFSVIRQNNLDFRRGKDAI